jgi:hypothetical protein
MPTQCLSCSYRCHNVTASPYSENHDEPLLPQHFAYRIIVPPKFGIAKEYKKLIQDPTTTAQWTKSFANKLGQLAQSVDSADTFAFSSPKVLCTQKQKKSHMDASSWLPSYHKKSAIECAHLTAGGYLMDYPGGVSTKTADLTTSAC